MTAISRGWCSTCIQKCHLQTGDYDMDLPAKKGLRSEHEYVQTSEGIRQKQHDRMVQICEALIQAASWMRECDMTPYEIALRDHAQEFVKSSVLNTLRKAV